MKTASDILMELLTLESKGIKTLTYKLDEAKALAEVERKVLEAVEPMCKQVMMADVPITQEASEFIQAYIGMYQLREKMGLQ